MRTAEYLRALAQEKKQYGMPILSFPAVQKIGVTVGELVNNSELQAQTMAAAAQNMPAAAAVSLMDLSVEAEAFGAQVKFSEDEVPTIVGQLVDGEDAANELKIPAVGDARTGIYVEAVRLAKQRITDRPVLAGCLGPYSLAGRLMDVTEIMYLCFDEPDAVHTVLEKATDFLIEYCRAFRDAGADGVVLAEPLAGLLSPDMNEEFSVEYVKRLIDTVQTDDFAVVYHNCGNAVVRQLDEIFTIGAAAYHFGNAIDMRDVMAKAPQDALCMGNIDPAGEFAGGTPESIRTATMSLLRDIGHMPNFLISSGCDVPPHAKWDNIDAFFRAIDEYNAEV